MIKQVNLNWKDGSSNVSTCIAEKNKWRLDSMTGSPLNRDNEDDLGKSIPKVSTQNKRGPNYILLFAALAALGVIIITFIIVYEFAQEQNDRAKIQQLAQEFKKKHCASISSSPNEYLYCIQS